MGGGDIRRVPGAFIYLDVKFGITVVPPLHTGIQNTRGDVAKFPLRSLVAEPFHDPLACKAPKTKLFYPEVRRDFQRGSTTEQLDVSSSGKSRETCLYRLLQVTVACMWTQLCVHRRKSRIFLSMGRHYRFFKRRNWNISVLVKKTKQKKTSFFLIPSGGFESVRCNSTVTHLSCFC